MSEKSAFHLGIFHSPTQHKEKDSLCFGGESTPALRSTETHTQPHTHTRSLDPTMA